MNVERELARLRRVAEQERVMHESTRRTRLEKLELCRALLDEGVTMTRLAQTCGVTRAAIEQQLDRRGMR